MSPLVDAFVNSAFVADVDVMRLSSPRTVIVPNASVSAALARLVKPVPAVGAALRVMFWPQANSIPGWPVGVIDTEMLSPNPITFDETVESGDEVRRLDPEYAWPADADQPLATASAITVYRAEADLAPGSGWEAGTMSALHFEIDSDGKSTARGARSQQVAGFYVMAPK